MGGNILYHNEEESDRIKILEIELRNNIKELKRKNSELLNNIQKYKEVEYRLKQTQKIAGLGSWEYDIKKDIFWSTDIVYKIIGNKKDMNKDDYIKIIHPDDRDYVVNTFLSLMNTKITSTNEIEYRIMNSDDNSIKHIIVRCTLIIKNNKPYKFSGAIMDISDRKKYESLLKHEKEKAEKADKLKTIFLSNMSHEIEHR
jgi:PAS domain-containing protein